MDRLARQLRGAGQRPRSIITGKVAETSFGSATVTTWSGDGYSSVPSMGGATLPAGSSVVMIHASDDPQDVRILGLGGYAVP